VIAAGKSDKPGFADSLDPVLAKASHTIALDEAAHFNFFLEIARLFLYYYPAQAMEALADVVKHFSMPALELLPDEPLFTETLYRGAIHTPRQLSRDVLQVVLKSLGVAGRKALQRGIGRARRAPGPDGVMRETTIAEALDYGAVETAVKSLFGRIKKNEARLGLSEIDPTRFVPSGLAIDPLKA
jgi:acyl-[acyl-carrier-protein] desaturase